MARKPRWVLPLIAVAVVVIFFIVVPGSACAATIHGTVTDTNNVRVAGATVTLYQNGSVYVSFANPARTDVTGTYQFPGLPDGAYSVQADKDGFISPSDSRVLTGSDIEINLKITGYDSKAVTPTIKAYVTPSPTPVPVTPKPTAKPTPTLVPLPPPTPEPGFGLLLALIALGLIVAMRRH